jgi:hypothetical protein
MKTNLQSTPDVETMAYTVERAPQVRTARRQFGSTLLAALFAVVGFALTGCSMAQAPGTSGPSVAQSTGTTEQALESGGAGGSSGYMCGALGCICYGDFDCNNMFTDGVCGSWPAKCYSRGYCECAPWVRRTQSPSVGVFSATQAAEAR